MIRIFFWWCMLRWLFQGLEVTNTYLVHWNQLPRQVMDISIEKKVFIPNFGKTLINNKKSEYWYREPCVCLRVISSVPYSSDRNFLSISTGVRRQQFKFCPSLDTPLRVTDLSQAAHFTLSMCSRVQKRQTKYKNTGLRHAFFHKCLSRRLNLSIEGGLRYTALTFD